MNSGLKHYQNVNHVCNPVLINLTNKVTVSADEIEAFVAASEASSLLFGIQCNQQRTCDTYDQRFKSIPYQKLIQRCMSLAFRKV